MTYIILLISIWNQNTIIMRTISSSNSASEWLRVNGEESDSQRGKEFSHVGAVGGVHLLGNNLIPAATSASRSTIIFWALKIITILLCILMFATSIIGKRIFLSFSSYRY